MASSAQRWEIVGEKVGSYRNERECRAREWFWALRTASASCFAALRWFASRVRARQGGWYAYAGSMLGGSAWWVVNWYGIALLQDALGGVEEGEAAQRRIRSTSKRDRHRTGRALCPDRKGKPWRVEPARRSAADHLLDPSTLHVRQRGHQPADVQLHN